MPVGLPGYDVVLMDPQKPVLDGYDATRRIRAELDLVALPVVPLIAGAPASECAAAAGMDVFVSKPFNPAEQMRRTLCRLDLKTPVRPQLLAPSPAIEAPATLIWPQVEDIDGCDIFRESLLFEDAARAFEAVPGPGAVLPH